MSGAREAEPRAIVFTASPGRIFHVRDRGYPLHDPTPLIVNPETAPNQTQPPDQSSSQAQYHYAQ